MSDTLRARGYDRGLSVIRTFASKNAACFFLILRTSAGWLKFFTFLEARARCMSRRCLIAYLARSIDPRCTQPDKDAAVEHFSLLFFLRCFLTKEEQRSARTCTRSWNWSALTECILLQNRRSTAGLEQHSTEGHVCLRGNLPNICCLLQQRLNRGQASRHCQETVSKCSWHEPRAARLTQTHVTVLFLCPS